MPVVTDPGRPEGRLLVDTAAREIGRFEVERRNGRSVAERFTLANGVTPEHAAAAIVVELRGWRISTDEPLARHLLAAGGRAGRHSHAMSRDLVASPAATEWDDPPGFRLTAVDRPPIDLAAACAAAFPADHVDYRHTRPPEHPEIELEGLMSGRTMGPLLPCSGLAVAADGSVAGAILINGTQGEPPLGGPWISLLFRHPDARGCGTALLRRALALATRDGLPALGLAVTHGNPAAGLYDAHGFAHQLEAVDVEL